MRVIVDSNLECRLTGRDENQLIVEILYRNLPNGAFLNLYALSSIVTKKHISIAEIMTRALTYKCIFRPLKGLIQKSINLGRAIPIPTEKDSNSVQKIV